MGHVNDRVPKAGDKALEKCNRYIAIHYVVSKRRFAIEKRASKNA